MRMRKKKNAAGTSARAQTRPAGPDAYAVSGRSPASCELLRSRVPIIGAAIGRLVNLTVGFTVNCPDPAVKERFDSILAGLPQGSGSVGLRSFICRYFDELLTTGTAVGEIVPSPKGVGLWLVPAGDVVLRRPDGDPCRTEFIRAADMTPVSRPELMFMTALSPAAGEIRGRPLTEGLAEYCGTLGTIFEMIEKNRRRTGNVRYCVSCGADESGGESAESLARTLAEGWSQAMSSDTVRDFICVGDVKVSTIGADSKEPDVEAPVRQLLEQIVAKTGVPPFLLGLSWSTTERMASLQTDLLTTELENYRTLLTPVIEKIAAFVLRFLGSSAVPEVVWDEITLQDRLSEAKAAYYDRLAQNGGRG